MKLWQELGRRKVTRTVVYYVGGAWVAMQVADILFQAWGVPETALRFLVNAAVAIFPLVLVFGWRFDITSEGLVRTGPAGSDGASGDLRRGDHVILSAIGVAALVIIVGSFGMIRNEVAAGPDIGLASEWHDNSVAVLPFTSLDLNPETQLFSDGITEEILYRLSSLKALHVLASNSSFAFRDSEASPAEIISKLGVRYLLQGSIRRENEQVRVTARLIDEAGFQVWTESFERRMESVFAMQTEIASTVASEIIDEIVPIQDLPAGRTTSNMEAYNAYLAGRARLDRRTANWRELASADLRRAIELDPDFAPPHAALAMAISVNTGQGPQWQEARDLVDTALRLDPELAEAHAMMGLTLMAESKLYPASLSLRKALNLDPSLGFAYNVLAIALQRMWRLDEALEVRQKGIAVDPLNPPMVVNMAGYESSQGRFDRAEQLLLRLTGLPEPPPLALSVLHNLYFEWGFFVEALAAARDVTRLEAANGSFGGMDFMAWTYACLGMNEDATYWADLARRIAQDDLATLDLTMNLLSFRAPASPLGDELGRIVNEAEFRPGEDSGWRMAQFGLVNIRLGNFDKGAEQLDYGLRLYQAGWPGTEPVERIDVATIAGNEEDVVWTMHWLAYAYRKTGRNEEADDILRELEDRFGLDDHPSHQVLIGNEKNALQLLRSMDGRKWATYYGPGRYYEIVHSPLWAEAIRKPEFQAFLAEMKAEVDRQRAVVEAFDAEHDFRAEIESLLGLPD